MCLNNIAYSGQTPMRDDERLGVVRIGNGRQYATTRDTGSAIYCAHASHRAGGEGHSL
jgi:hypothetical protein